MPARSYLIVGDGVFGISTALHILDAGQKVDLIDQAALDLIVHRQPGAASDDISKIIRIDYPSVSRMKEAIHIHDLWTTNERYRTFYLPVGRIVAYDERALTTLRGHDSARTYLNLGARTRLSKDVLREHYGTEDVPDGLTYTYNTDDGMVNWGECVQSLRNETRELCTVREVKVEKLIHQQGRITAITFHSGEINTTNKMVILTAGSWIGDILDKSGIEQPLISRAPIAVGIFAFVLQLEEDQLNFFWGKPVFSHIGHGLYASVNYRRTSDGF